MSCNPVAGFVGYNIGKRAQCSGHGIEGSDGGLERKERVMQVCGAWTSWHTTCF